MLGDHRENVEPMMTEGNKVVGQDYKQKGAINAILGAITHM